MNPIIVNYEADHEIRIPLSLFLNLAQCSEDLAAIAPSQKERDRALTLSINASRYWPEHENQNSERTELR